MCDKLIFCFYLSLIVVANQCTQSPWNFQDKVYNCVTDGHSRSLLNTTWRSVPQSLDILVPLYIHSPFWCPIQMKLEWSWNDTLNGTNLLPLVLEVPLLVPGKHLLLGVKAAHELVQGAPSFLQASMVGLKVAPHIQGSPTIMVASRAAVQFCQFSCLLPTSTFIVFHSFKLCEQVPERDTDDKGHQLRCQCPIQIYIKMPNRGSQSHDIEKCWVLMYSHIHVWWLFSHVHDLVPELYVVTLWFHGVPPLSGHRHYLYKSHVLCCDHVLFWHVGTLLSYSVPPLSGQKHIIDQYPPSPEHEPLFIMPYKCTPWHFRVCFTLFLF